MPEGLSQENPSSLSAEICSQEDLSSGKIIEKPENFQPIPVNVALVNGHRTVLNNIPLVRSGFRSVGRAIAETSAIPIIEEEDYSIRLRLSEQHSQIISLIIPSDSWYRVFYCTEKTGASMLDIFKTECTNILFDLALHHLTPKHYGSVVSLLGPVYKSGKTKSFRKNLENFFDIRDY
jgi:hypothetical protein